MKNTIQIFFFILSTFLVSYSEAGRPINMKPAALQILELFKTNDIVFMGEIHHLNEQRSLLTELAIENARLNAYDIHATEAVWKIDQPILDHFLATGSEDRFFIPEGWFKSYHVRNAFRTFQRTQQSVCGIDVDMYSAENKTKRSKEMADRIASFPQDVVNIILRQSGKKTVTELLKVSNPIEHNYLMAVNIRDCMQENKKMLIYTGQDHTYAMDPVLQNQLRKNNTWWGITEWLQFMKPNLRFTVVKNMIDRSSELDAYGKGLVYYFRSLKSESPTLVRTSSLPESVKKSSIEDGIEYWRRADFVVIGNPGTPERKVQAAK